MRWLDGTFDSRIDQRDDQRDRIGSRKSDVKPPHSKELAPKTLLPDGASLRDTIFNILLAVAILGGSYVIMHFFARAMYVRCLACGTLNARRRSVCRNCAVELKK